MLESKIEGVRMVALSTTLPIESKLGTDNKKYYVCNELQTTSDLGFDAANRMISSLSIEKGDIGILLFGSKTPDYRSPNTAAILQGRLELPIDCICFDTNVGANGFSKMVQVASSILIKSNRKYALVIVGNTPSKLRKNQVDEMFELSDACTAILLQKSTSEDILTFSTYSAGDYYKGSYLREGGFRAFNENMPFDGSNIENFIVKSESKDLNDFFNEIRLYVNDENQMINSFILQNLKIKDKWENERSIKADASELPLLLETLINEELIENNDFQFISAGEGMALMKMTINHKPQILPKNHTIEFFEEYKVSHEM
jgi:3-oxoacyl-[acyl-carrier-protein] synthase III